MAENIKNRKLNLFDVIVILVLIAAIIVFIFVSRNNATNQPEMGDEAVYLLEISSIKPEIADQMQVGDKLYSTSTKDFLGDIISVEILESTRLLMNYDAGNYELTTDPDRVNVMLRVEAPITETETDLFIENKTNLKANISFDVWGPGYAAQGSILSIERGGTGK